MEWDARKQPKKTKKAEKVQLGKATEDAFFHLLPLPKETRDFIKNNIMKPSYKVKFSRWLTEDID